ncbi:hypothetical protein [Flexibacterium corallicola]|uniref:hypothetical protein n=1 Tax=Flexibacterium corallicola TaxID=3037259 RepID=UPI00286FA355|nr:hypothetical protein [Pseudovibrio sp. M1P-2-3]
MFSNFFDREGSTLGIMDDLQIAVHTYDGCARGCSGCLVDKHFKNGWRFRNIIPSEGMRLIHSRVEEYYDWLRANINTKDSGYFGKNGFTVDHYSYTFRFGNHSELPEDMLDEIAESFPSQYRVFSTAPSEDIQKFVGLRNRYPGRYFLEIIYDPIADSPHDIRDMILTMRQHGILGYPEVLVTRRLLDQFSPEKFVDEAMGPLSDISVQMQFGRYTPSKTRGYRTSQVVTVDEEVKWLAEVARLTVTRGYDIHPIPIGEYAVTLLDEYGENIALSPNGYFDVEKLPEPEPFHIKHVKDKTRDIFLSSLYVDHNLDLFVWSESMGQHVLDRNFGYEPLGNLKNSSIQSIITEPYGVLEKMLNEVVRSLITHPKCVDCRYKSFCASHAVPLFRKWHPDNGEHCYGYLPVIREFQKSKPFLENMISGFKELDF